MRTVSLKRLIPAILILVWLELTLLPFFFIWEPKPDLFFVFLAFYAFRINQREMIPLAFLLGFIKDLLANSFFGLETASFVGGAFLLQFLAVRFDREERWIQLAGLFSFSCYTLIFYSMIAWIVGTPYQAAEAVFAKSFLISAYTAAAGLVLFPLLEQWLKPTLRTRQYELF